MRRIAILGTFLAVAAQTPPAFEAASVKPSAPGSTDQSVGFEPGGRFVAKSLTLKGLLRMAYDVRGFQISGGPKWVDSDLYDVETKAEGNPRTPEVRRMLQGLLADRFKLKLRRESRETPVYWLVVGKSGAKLQQADGEATPNHIRRGSLDTRTTMEGLARLFSGWLDRQVLDRTGLDGLYEIKLEWMPEEQPGVEIASQPGASLFSSVQEQLGLRLESKKGPVDILIIESAEKPAEN
jgi:uncharacterized protein (TIGR03435 family)